MTLSDEDLVKLRKIAAIWQAQEGTTGPNVNFAMDRLGELLSRLDHAEPLVTALYDGQEKLRSRIAELEALLRAEKVLRETAEAGRDKIYDASMHRFAEAVAALRVGSVALLPQNDLGAPTLPQAITALREERDSLAAQVKRWEDKEVARAVNCCGSQDRAEAAEAALKALADAVDEAFPAPLRETLVADPRNARVLARLADATALLQKVVS